MIRHVFLVLFSSVVAEKLPLVITTWGADGFQQATRQAWESLTKSGDRLEALITGLSTCERLQCDGTVGYGGSPDEQGGVRLDALVFDGPNHKLGAVASMANITDAARVAHAVMKYSKHSILVGDEATRFAVEMGFIAKSLETDKSTQKYLQWKMANCQPNFRKNVSPDPTESCGPYRPMHGAFCEPDDSRESLVGAHNHDTIGMIVIDNKGDISAGTSTNGATHKIPGRVGDSPLPGAGAYVDNDVGGAAATGDGDIMLRFLPSYQAVENMRLSMSPQKSAENAVLRIATKYHRFMGAVIAARKDGEFGAACHGMQSFSFSVHNPSSMNVKLYNVSCFH